MSILAIIQDIVPNNDIGLILKQYGLMGLAFVAMITMMIRQNKAAEKRITDLEDAQKAVYEAHINDHKETIKDYVELVRQKIQVLSDLTGCLKAMKDTLERIERKEK